MRRISNLPVFLLLACAYGDAMAADLQVRVFERGGNAPLPGAAVCLGTLANPAQFGTSLTDAAGYARFDTVPRAPLLLTASKRGFRGAQESLIISSGNRRLVLSLPRGGGGPRCRLAPEQAEGGSGKLVVNRFAVNNGAAVTDSDRVTLDHALSAQATHYRASERADFLGAGWQTYTGNPGFRLSPGQGNKVVYFQVRRYTDISGAVLETRSQVVNDSITRR